jgi:hypothetical protein
MRAPVIGNWNNPYDNTEYKNIDVIDDDGRIGYVTSCTEWFAELVWAGWWRVNPMWAWEQANPGEPFPSPRQWVGDVADPPFE